MRARALLAAGVIAAAHPCAAAAQDPPRVLTLREAVDMARRTGPRILDAADRLDDARLAERRSNAAFRPSLVPRLSGALGSGDLANQRYGADFAQRFRWGTEISASVAASSSRNQLGTFFYSETTLAVTQPLYRSSPDPHRRQSEAAAETVALVEQETAFAERAAAVEAAAAYFAIVAGEQLVRAAEQAVVRHRHLLAVTEAKLEIGTVSQLDVLRARRLVREAEGRLDDARAQADDARDGLRLLIGNPGLGDFSVASAPPAAVEDPVAITGDGAVGNSAAVRAARSALAASERDARGARRPLLPQVDFTLAWTRRETGPSLRSSLGTGGFRVVPMIQLSLPTGPAAWSAAQASAEIDVARRRRELRAAEMQAGIDTRRAVRNHARLRNQLRGAEEGVAAAAELVEVARARFDLGLSNNLELVAAETEWFGAEARRIAAASDLALAALRLKVIAGTLDFSKDFGQ